MGAVSVTEEKGKQARRLRMAVLAAVTLSHVLSAFAQSNEAAPTAKLALDLDRGICIDRQFRAIPPEDIMRFTREDIRLIKSMGFTFVKVLVNPEPLTLEGHLDPAKTWYLREMVECVVGENLPVVVCIHPEWEYKKGFLSDPDRFAQFLVFLEDTARFLAANWGPKQLALQLLTEPVTSGIDWNELLPRLWQVARKAMPEHTLILAGDQVGKIDGLVGTQPVDDANVMYSFTYYDPFVLTLQGGDWLTPKLWSYLGGVPYPSSPEIIAAHKQAILGKIPADPPDWRPAAEGMLSEYGEARWNREKIAAYVQKLADWNTAHGGGLRIWCAEFGCYQRTIAPDDRARFIRDVREAFEERGIGWAYWSYNEVFTIMEPGGTPFGPAKDQTPDAKMLDALFGK
ncbi:MAG: glycoside hydrolase family 5 protein [Candidatus Hydrogenedentes bacterium]|nr:glycoside hydrolase family 5 protein [Candidatus Hydrogenedentota bacterium]